MSHRLAHCREMRQQIAQRQAALAGIAALLDDEGAGGIGFLVTLSPPHGIWKNQASRTGRLPGHSSGSRSGSMP
jgi:hypothetical protein